MRLTSTARLGALAVTGALALAACGSDDDDAQHRHHRRGATTRPPRPRQRRARGAGHDVPPVGVTDEEKEAVATAYADLVFAGYDASIASATTMQAAIDAFLADPTDATLDAAKQAWLTARDDYGPTEAFRFYDGPIDNPDDGPEGQINAWPMDEAYVDYVEGDATAGIINDTAGVPEITAEVIVAANEEGGETNISTGWHAIEFLLWGQDLPTTAPGPAGHRLHHRDQRRAARHLPEAVTQQLDRRPRPASATSGPTGPTTTAPSSWPTPSRRSPTSSGASAR